MNRSLPERARRCGPRARGHRAVARRVLGEAIPAFLTIVTMPLSLSIADGLAVDFISFALLRALSGRRDVSWLAYLFATLFLLRLVLA